MDAETRGPIEKHLDYLISSMDMTNTIRWVLREIPVHSPEDFALGYLIGFSMKHAYDIAYHKKVIKKLDENREREFGKERMKEIEKEYEEWKERSGDYKPIRVYWTKKDKTDVGDVLKRRLVDMKRKVSRDFHK